MKYTRKQISEAIKYWEDVLVQMNESKSKLLDIFAEEFGNDVVFSNKPFNLTNDNIKIIYSIFKTYFFEKEISFIPVKLLSYNEICNVLKSRYDKYKTVDDPDYKKPNHIFYGVYVVTCKNDRHTFKIGESIEFDNDDLIMLNMSQLKNMSFALHIASLCHEMIHYFDKLHGEYKLFIKAQFVTGIAYNIHNTDTFERKMMEANNDCINVIQQIPAGETNKISATKAVELALKALKESDNGKRCEIKQTDEIHPCGDHILITTF